MGFLFTALEAPVSDKKHKTSSVALMHKLGCRLCPRANSSCVTPSMKPRGPADPLIYMLGTQPDKEDDEDDQQFSRDSRGGRLLRAYLPDDVDEADIRWNNIVRTHLEGMPRVTSAEVECCRPSVEADILATRPVAIFGFGTEPLHWVRPGMRLADMRGRRFPVRLDDFVTWYYCFDDPLELRRPVPNKWGGWNVDPAREVTFKFDLRRAVADLEHAGTPSIVTNKQALTNIEVITKRHGGVKRVLELLDWASHQEYVGFDYETSELRPYRPKARILSLGISGREKAFAFGFHHDQADWTSAEKSKLDKAIRSFLNSPTRKVVHNLAFELEWTGVEFGTEYIRTDTWEDSTSQAFIIDERTGGMKRRDGPASLQFGCRLYFDLAIKDMSPEIDTASKKNMAAVPLDTILPYNALDAKGHRLLYEAQNNELSRIGLMDAYRMKVDHVKTVVLTQIKGAPIDAQANQDLFTQYSARVNEALKKIESTEAYDQFKTRTNRFFNPDSDTDMVVMLRDIIRTDKGQNQDGSYTTEKEVLETIKHPLIKPILQFRRATKALSTYILPLRPDSEHNYDGWCHTILNTTVARTGRLSSEHPNVQNFPVRDPEMGKVRAQIGWTKELFSYIANDNERKLIMKVDYGQIEARVIAMVSKDPVFVKALWERYDVHMAWAVKIEQEIPRILNRWTGDDYPTREKAMKALRTAVKNEWTFPLFFGAQLKGVAQFLQVEERELLGLREEFWDTFKGVKRWQETLEKEYRETNQIKYITGRIARGPISINQLFNYPIQGPTCDIVLDAMKRVSKRSVEDWNFQPIFQIHDDLTFLLPEKRIEDYAEPIITDMLSLPYDFVNVPITLEVGVGPNWHDITSEGDYSTDTWFKNAA